MDAMTGAVGEGECISKHDQGDALTISKVHLSLESGQSIILRLFSMRAAASSVAGWNNTTAPKNLKPWRYWDAAGKPVVLSGSWRVRFIDGGPALPKEFSTEKLASWTEFGANEAQSFAGTALYTLSFDAPDTKPEHWSL